MIRVRVNTDRSARLREENLRPALWSVEPCIARQNALAIRRACPDCSAAVAKRGAMEGKQAARWTRLSYYRCRVNEVGRKLSVRPYSLGNLWRQLVVATTNH